MRLRILMPGSRYAEMALERQPVNDVDEDDDDDMDIVDDDEEAETARKLASQDGDERPAGAPAAIARVEDDELTSLTWLQDTNLLQGCIGQGAAAGTARAVDICGAINNANSSRPSTVLVASGSSMNGVTPFVQQQQMTPLANAAAPPAAADGDEQPPQPQLHQHYNPTVHVCSKPPYSFSCLIFMAIEDSPSKALPVKDIYSWILAHFPYFQNAPTGWKNSVRHNLSLNKCFLKVDKGQNIAKGSLWCVDPEHRPNLLQALRKTPFKPCIRLPSDSSSSSGSSATPAAAVIVSFDHLAHCAPVVVTSNNGSSAANLLNPDLFPFLSKRLTASSTEDVEVDAAATMLSLKNGPGLRLDRSSSSSIAAANGEMARRGRETNGRGGNTMTTTSASFNPARERRHSRMHDKLGVYKRTEHRSLGSVVREIPIRSVIVGPSTNSVSSPVVVTTVSLNDDHTYSSSSSTNSPVRPVNSGDSPSSSIDEPFEFGHVNGYGGSVKFAPPRTAAVDGDSGGDSGVTRSDSGDETEDEGDDEEKEDSRRPKSVRCPVIVRTVTTASGHCRVVVENEEQMKIVEGADALLNLAGFSSSRNVNSNASATTTSSSGGRVRRKRKPSRRHLRRVLPAMQEAHR